MNWFTRLFKKDVEQELSVHTQQVPMSTIYRWYLYDTHLGDPNELADLIGLNRVSAEGDDKEKQESAARTQTILPLLPYLELIADASVDTLLGLQELKSRKDPNLAISEQDVEESKLVYKAIAMSTLIGAVSIGSHLGLISVDGFNVNTGFEAHDFFGDTDE